MKIIPEVGDYVRINKTVDPADKGNVGKVGELTRIRRPIPSQPPYFYVKVTDKQVYGIKCVSVSVMVPIA